VVDDVRHVLGTVSLSDVGPAYRRKQHRQAQLAEPARSPDFDARGHPVDDPASI
jgi:hypothetical protein